MPQIDMKEFGSEAVEDLPEGLDFGDEPVEDEDETDSDVETEESTEEAEEEESEEESTEEEAEEAESEEESEEDESDDDEPPAKKGKEPFVPKSRMDQALRKARAAEDRVRAIEAEMARLQQEQVAASAPKPLTAEEIKSKMALANEALVAGDTEKAAELQAELMASMVARPEAPKAAPERDMLSEIEERLEFKQTLKDVYQRFPQLDENSADFNAELGEEAVDLQAAYIKRGYTLAEATKKAAESVAKLHDLADVQAPATPAPKASVAKAKQAAKSKEKIAKATRAAPDLAGSRGDPEDVAFDIFSASEEEFMALPKSAQDRLLGNVV